MCELNCRQSHDCYAHAKDESKEITDTRHLKFNRGIDSSFHVNEELHNSRSFEDATTIGEGLFLKAVAYPGILSGGGSTNSVEDRGQRERDLGEVAT